MSSLLDDWLKSAGSATSQEDVRPGVGPQTTSSPDGGDGGGGEGPNEGGAEDVVDDVNLPPDLQLLPDLGLPDIKWWVDLEFLDLASGPPANISSAHGAGTSGTNRNMKTPTFDYHFPDIFFDSTTVGNLDVADLGLSAHTPIRQVPGTGDAVTTPSATQDGQRDHHSATAASLTDDHLDFEKGLLADLFQPTDVPSVPVTSSASTVSGSGIRPKDQMLADFPVPSPQRRRPSTPCLPPPPPSAVAPPAVKAMPDFGAVDLLKPNEKEYSLDVMQTFSKNFTELQEHFDKVTKQISTPAQETAAAAAVKVVEETEVPKVLRIKSVHTVYNTPQPQPPLPPEVSSPSGTVARLEIFTDKANDKTTFTVMPPQGSQTSGQSSVSVQTSDLSKATKLLKPVHLERLPLLQKILFSAGRKGGNGDDEMSRVPKRTIRHSNKEVDEARLSREEHDLIAEMKSLGVEYQRIDRCRMGNKIGWTCPENGCQKAFEKRSKLKLHIFSHRDIKPFKCTQEGCTWAFSTANHLTRHLASALHHKVEEGVYACHVDECKSKTVTFTTAQNLNAHLKRHSRPKDFLCQSSLACGARFQTKRALDTHLRNANHADLLPQHCCHQCDSQFFSAGELVSHAQTHVLAQADKKLRCQFEGCERTFPVKSLLVAHSRTHTGERPFKCGYCEMAFRTNSKMRRHERSHSNDRRFSCRQCGKTFFRQEHLRTHVNSAHGGIHLQSGSPAPFACPLHLLCSERFISRSQLYYHLKSHDGCTSKQSSQEPFRCVVASCNSTFSNGTQLASHVNTDHESAVNGSDVTCEEADAAVADLDFIDLLTSCGDEVVLHHQPDYVDEDQIIHETLVAAAAQDQAFQDQQPDIATATVVSEPALPPPETLLGQDNVPQVTEFVVEGNLLLQPTTMTTLQIVHDQLDQVVSSQPPANELVTVDTSAIIPAVEETKPVKKSLLKKREGVKLPQQQVKTTRVKMRPSILRRRRAASTDDHPPIPKSGAPKRYKNNQIYTSTVTTNNTILVSDTQSSTLNLEDLA